MTAVERYPSQILDDNFRHPTTSSDDPFKADPSRPVTTTSARITKKRIPPAVPSPPPLASRTRSRSRSPPASLRLSHENDSSRRIMASPAASGAELAGQWYFNETEANNTPSVLEGISIVEERSRRAKGVNFITQAGIVLKLPQLTIATASVFFHRFYMRYSMVPEKGGLHHYNIAATSLFLATKTEENCRKTKEIVIAVAKVAQKNSNLIIDEQSKEYWRWRDNILLYEELMLELLTFDVVLESPYNHLYSILRSLELDTNKPLRNAAWSWVCDSCLTMMCLLMPPRDIAIAAIYFAAKYTKETIPDDRTGVPWWEREGGRADRIRKAVAVMHEFYIENPLKKSQEQSPYYKGERGEEDLDSTRRPVDSPGTGSQNGQSQEDISKPKENGATREPSPQTSTSKLTAEETTGAGDSDAKLKAIANDPATHQANGHTNGHSDLATAEQKPSPKRKASVQDGEGSPTKRAKREDDAMVVDGEEGEVSG
ncbi:cyclin-K [Phlyctema vagabunda]|uniref:RNA polymerase II holoenzyme cyclin-like subunit n=1 Tax=Phlyctema vagabunda TaxID=108571 RepID=A0ABR4PC96_9HELO